MSGKSLFILGGGQIGRAAAARFAEQGWRVRIGQRRNPPAGRRALGMEAVRFDRDTDGDLERAIGEGADAVIDTIAYTSRHADQLKAVERSVGAFVVISSCSVYQDDDGRTLDEARETGFPRFTGAIPETQPTVAPGPETYSTCKMALERALGELTRPVTILRPGAIHGPGCNTPREWWFVKRVLDGRTRVPVAYDGESRFHTTAAANIVELCHRALGTGATGVFNIGDPAPPSVREIGEMIAAAMGHAWEIVRIEKHPVGTVGATPWSVPRPLLIDTSKAASIGYAPAITYAGSLKDTWVDLVDRARRQSWSKAFPGLSAYTEPWFDYAAEDALLAR